MSILSSRTLEPLEGRRLLAADVASLILINAQTDQPVPNLPLVDGAVIDLAKVGRQISVRADVNADAHSVRFNLDGNPKFKLEAVAPFALGGDSNGGRDYLPLTPSLGTHSLVVTAYGGTDGLAARGTTKTVVFQVVDTGTGTGGGTRGGTSVVRINAGGPTYTAINGRTFAPDANFTGGVQSASVYAVANTEDDALYQTRRYGASFSFAREVADGAYTLTLHFAEPTFTAAGARVFDVSAEGNLVIDDLDLVRAAGAKTALVRSFPVTVSDGQLDVSFVSSVNNAIVSAIELTPAAVAPPPPLKLPVWTPAPARVNAGGGSLIDSIGRPFEAGAGYFAGGIDVTPATYDVLGTNDDALFSSYREGTVFTFAKPVADGHYALWLEFADPISTAAGQRTFDVSAEGQLVLNDFDVFAATAVPANGIILAVPAAPGIAVVRKFDVTVSDGRLDLTFAGVQGSAIVSAVVLIPTDIPAAVLPFSGIGDYPNEPQHSAVRTAWSVKSASNLRQIAMGILLFTNDHKGVMPHDFTDLVSGRYVDWTPFANPRIPTPLPRGEASLLEQTAWVAEQRDYLYPPGLAGERIFRLPDGSIIAYENPDRTPANDLKAAFTDGHVSTLARASVVGLFGGSPVAPPEMPRPMQTAGDTAVVASQGNLRALGAAMQSYSNNNRGNLPPDLGTLVGYYVTDPLVFVNPRGTTPPPPAGVTRDETAAAVNALGDYPFPGARQRTTKPLVWAYENPAEMKDGINLLFRDGHVEFREMRWALETIASSVAVAPPPPPPVG